MFLYVHNNDAEIATARAVLSLFDCWYGSVLTTLPVLVDMKRTDAATAAVWLAKLAIEEFRFNGSVPHAVLTSQTSLRINAMDGLPGAAFPLVAAMFGPAGIVAALDRASVFGRECILEVAVAYVDRRPGSAETMTFTHRIAGRIVAAEELAGREIATVLDVFVPEKERAPFSRLSAERQAAYAKHFEETYIDFAQWYAQRSSRAEAGSTTALQPGETEVRLDDEWPDPGQLDPTLTLDRNTLIGFDPSRVPPPVPQCAARTEPSKASATKKEITSSP